MLAASAINVASPLHAEQHPAKKLAHFAMHLPICMQIHLAPLALMELACGSVWAQSHASIWTSAAPGVYSSDRAVKQEQESHTRKVVLPSGMRLFKSLWVELCSDLCFCDSFFGISATAEVYISSFSHLCKRPYLQNLFLYLVIFFPNENIKPDC